MTDPILATVLSTVQHSLSGQPLSFSQAEQFFSAVVKGDVEPVHLTALLVALKMRGETADEIAGFVAYLVGPEAGYITGASLTIDGGFGA